MTVNALALSEDDHAPDDGPPDQITLVRVATDREQEFADFMGAAAPRLARTAWLLCGDAHLADELVQQALTKTYLRWTTARERDPFPENVVPMLARLSTLPRDDGRWAIEVKWDGVRAIAYCQPGRVELQTRNLNTVTAQYPEVRRISRALGSHDAAATFDRTCEARLTPAITELTAGWAASPPTATERRSIPRASAYSCRAETRDKSAPSSRCCWLSRLSRLPSGAEPGEYFPVSSP